MSASTKTDEKTDCGGGTCVRACVLDASLTTESGGPAITPALSIAFWYKTDHVASGEAAISLQFDAIKAGETSTKTAWAPGYACGELTIIRTEVECIDGEDGKCPGYFKVKFPAIPGLGFSETSVEAR